MNLIKLIPYNLRERIRKILFGKNHFHDLMEFAQLIGVKTMFDVGAQRGYETILAAKAGVEMVFAFEPNKKVLTALCRNAKAEGVSGIVKPVHAYVTHYSAADPEDITISLSWYLLIAKIIGQPIFPGMVKIDTDGNDLRVLAGFPFDTCKPALFSVEWDETRAVDRKLLSHGYKLIYAIYKPQTRSRRAIFSRYSLSPEFYGDEWGDVIAVLPQHYVALRDKLFGF